MKGNDSNTGGPTVIDPERAIYERHAKAIVEAARAVWETNRSRKGGWETPKPGVWDPLDRAVEEIQEVRDARGHSGEHAWELADVFNFLVFERRHEAVRHGRD